MSIEYYIYTDKGFIRFLQYRPNGMEIYNLEDCDFTFEIDAIMPFLSAGEASRIARKLRDYKRFKHYQVMCQV